jgi:DNA-binding Lrp family transcriptional regulator
MTNGLDIVKALIEKNGEKISINRLSEKLEIDYKNVYNIVKKLEKESLVSLEKFGNAYNCILNKKVHPLIFQAEFERRKKLLENGDLKVLHRKLADLNFPFIALIFGSYAKGKESNNSDIDLMVISEKNRENQVQRNVSLFPLNIHLVSLNFEEFSSMTKSKEFNVVTEAIMANILLIGIEDYYRMLQNVG